MAKAVATWRLAECGSCCPRKLQNSYEHHHRQRAEKTNVRDGRFILAHGFGVFSPSWQDDMALKVSKYHSAITQGGGGERGGRGRSK